MNSQNSIHNIINKMAPFFNPKERDLDSHLQLLVPLTKRRFIYMLNLLSSNYTKSQYLLVLASVEKKN